jgi:hypothetical protein
MSAPKDFVISAICPKCGTDAYWDMVMAFACFSNLIQCRYCKSFVDAGELKLITTSERLS